jgi:hypothetical protein
MEERAGEEVRFYRFPLSSVLSPLVPRGERMESVMQPSGLVEVAPGLPAKAEAILNFFGRPLTN